MFVQEQCKRDLNGEFDESFNSSIISSSSSHSSRSKCSTERLNEHFLEPFVPETCKNVFVQKQCKRDLNGEFDEISAIVVVIVVVVVVVVVGVGVGVGEGVVLIDRTNTFLSLLYRKRAKTCSFTDNVNET